MLYQLLLFLLAFQLPVPAASAPEPAFPQENFRPGRARQRTQDGAITPRPVRYGKECLE